MKEMDAIGKDQRNTQQGWSFRGIDDMYNALQKVMASNGLFTVPTSIEIIKEEPVTSAKGAKGFHFMARYTFTFFAEDGSSVQAVTIGESVDYGDKNANKAASVAHKYALIEVFCIPTKEEKDPDFVAHEIKQCEKNIPNHDDSLLSKTPFINGKHAGKRFCDINLDELISYYDFIELKCKEEKKLMPDIVKTLGKYLTDLGV
jgi:hypothetical protein